MPAVAEMLCQRCSARTEALIAPRRRSVDRCRCGGIRQVVRVVHHQDGEAPAKGDGGEREAFAIARTRKRRSTAVASVRNATIRLGSGGPQ
jgi:hypothetical protein